MLGIDPEPGDKPAASKGPHWILWVIIFLIPIPFSPWWLGIICAAVCGLLIYAAMR